MDIIHIQDLKVSTIIGVYAWEKQIKQTVLLDIKLSTDISIAAQEHDLSKTIDYAALSQQLSEELASKRFELLETLVVEVASSIHQNFGVELITITATKPHAIKNAKGVSITITRDFRVTA